MDLLAHGLPPVPVWGQFDRHVARALVDLGRATERPRPEALDGRALVHVGAVDGELVGAELVGRLRVGHGGVEELEDVVRDRARRVQQDRLRVLDALAADVVHHEPRLARRAAHVARAGAHDQVALGTRRARAGGRPGRGLGGAAAATRLRPLLRSLLVRVGGSGGILAGLLRLVAVGGDRLKPVPVVLHLLALSGGRRSGPGLGHVVVGQARDQLGLGAALREPAGLELVLQLIDLQRLPAALRRRALLVRRHRILTLSLPAWPRNTRVGANSPSLCPTIDSEMKTGTCFRPSWTAIVWPTISGKIVEVRDQVLTMVLLPDSFICSIRVMRRSCTNGPFLDERDIYRRPFLPRRRPRTM